MQIERNRWKFTISHRVFNEIEFLSCLPSPGEIGTMSTPISMITFQQFSILANSSEKKSERALRVLTGIGQVVSHFECFGAIHKN